MTSRSIYFVLLTALGISLIGSMSVIGLLQTTERVNTSGIIVQQSPLPSPPPSPPPSPTPPEPTIEIDVYYNVQCTQIATDVAWGSIEVGKSVNKDLYIKNSGDSKVSLNLDTENWSPTNAVDYIDISWDYDGSALDSGEVRKVTLTLIVSLNIFGIDTFSFDIVFTGIAS